MANCYVNGERIIKSVGFTSPNQNNDYEIIMLEDEYVFNMDDKMVSIKRRKPCHAGIYYLLYPYFGGDETAPHDIDIFIRRIFHSQRALILHELQKVHDQNEVSIIVSLQNIRALPSNHWFYPTEYHNQSLHFG